MLAMHTVRCSLSGHEIRRNLSLLVLGAVTWSCARAAPEEPPVAPPPSQSPEHPVESVQAQKSQDTPEPQPSPARQDRTWNFDEDTEGQPPQGFAFGKSANARPARWIIAKTEDAPSGKQVLAQVENTRKDRFASAVAEDVQVGDGIISVACKPIAGRIDQACGLVFRYRDQNNYYVTRANALENNVRLYTVVDGKRRQLATWDGAVAAGMWHEYRVEVRGDHMLVFWNDAQVIDHHDSTFDGPGSAGVWIKADSVAHFDDFTVTPLDEQSP
jgi:hypothetical protein